MRLAERIKALRGKTNAAEFCRQFNIHRNTLFGYESGDRVPNATFLEELCREYKANPSWLLLGEGPMYDDGSSQPADNIQPADPVQDEFYYIPMVKTKLSAGGGAFVESEDLKGYYAFRKDWIHRIAPSSKNLVLMRVIGDSMAPTILESDTVMIDTDRKDVTEGKLYAIRFDHTVMIKRLAYRPEGKILIISDNRKDYEPYDVDAKSLHVIGQIIFFSRVLISE